MTSSEPLFHLFYPSYPVSVILGTESNLDKVWSGTSVPAPLDQVHQICRVAYIDAPSIALIPA
ncbi:MAG: hypothetical protein JRM87_01945 [Nitrososphaerota archaeon]|nr:hypothetical protein [Nitrososphaerota archaeon]